MTDFTLSPDDPAPPEKPTKRPLRMVSTGVHPTAVLPVPNSAEPESASCYLPCPACGAKVLVGRTKAGLAVALDTQTRTYSVDFPPRVAYPTLHESRAYPVHQCPQKGTS
jgi:hypothetical protein